MRVRGDGWRSLSDCGEVVISNVGGEYHERDRSEGEVLNGVSTGAFGSRSEG